MTAIETISIKTRNGGNAVVTFPSPALDAARVEIVRLNRLLDVACDRLRDTTEELARMKKGQP